MNIRYRFSENPNGAPLVRFAVAGASGPAPVSPKSAAATESLALAREDGFRGKAGETLCVRGRDTTLWIGLGDPEGVDGSARRLAGAALVQRWRDARWPRLAVAWPAGWDAPETLGEFAEGTRLAAYRFTRHQSGEKKASPDKEVVFLTDASGAREKALRRADVFVGAVDFARDLINTPASLKAPEQLARHAAALAGGGVKVTLHRKPALERMGAGGLLGVGRGSAQPPVMVHLRYKPARPRARIALVGKGVTFDSGGLSLKPADGMMTMKYDMAGAAIVMAVFWALKRLRPDVEVHGVTPLTENMPGPAAYKPGDVVRAMNGKTIEVLNTDAEGRVILADALSYAARLPVDRVIDVATLTGAATVALGKAYAALMTDDDALARALTDAARAAGEKIWRLPLEKTYRDHIKSNVADLKNIGNPGEAGTIVGGLFLKEFAGDKPWAHLDMAGVGWNGAGSALSPAGATGALVRTFLNFVTAGGKA